jgi:hypothetical protein
MGQKRPADVIGAAVMVARIATGEIQDSKIAEGNGVSGSAPSHKHVKKVPKTSR